MFFRKKTVKVSTEKVIVRYIKTEMDRLESPIIFNYGEKRYRFSYAESNSYAGNTSDSYELQDFYFAKKQINRAFNLIKKALINIKDFFKAYSVDNLIVINKITQLLKLEKESQEKIGEEQLERLKLDVKAIITLSNEKLFQTLTRDILMFITTTKEELINYIENNFVTFDTIKQITQVLKEKNIRLPEELSNYKTNISGYVIIYNLENFLRVLITIVLKGQPSKQIMPVDLLNQIKEAKEMEKLNKWCDERYGGDLFYLYLSDLVKIIDYKKSNFIQAEIKIDKVRSEIEKINTIRNKLAHNNVITEDELHILETNSKIIYNYFKEFHNDVASYKFKLKKKV